MKETDGPGNCKRNMSQEIDATEVYYTNMDISNFENKDKPTVTINDNNNTKYFLPGPNSDNGLRMTTEITQQLQREFKDVFNGIECFNHTFSLQVKPDSKPYQVPPRCIGYALQQPFKEELECPKQQDIITPLGINETDEWCNSFVLVPKLNRKVRLHLDPARLNQALIRLVHRGLMVNDIFPKLNYVQYLSLSDASSWYHNLKLDERSSYLNTFTCQFSRYRYKRLPFAAVLTGDMVQRKIAEIFKNLPNVFAIADDILVVGLIEMIKIMMTDCREFYKYADK